MKEEKLYAFTAWFDKDTNDVLQELAALLYLSKVDIVTSALHEYAQKMKNRAPRKRAINGVISSAKRTDNISD